jgi:hypothetical protein
MGQARHLLRPRRAGLFREHPQGPRGGEDPRGIPAIVGAEDHRSGDLEAAFIKVNPGLSSSAISVICSSRRLSEVRICLSKDMQFRCLRGNDPPRLPPDEW